MFADVTAEILADALLHNVRALRACCAARTLLCAPLKANAYGHGLSAVAPVLERGEGSASDSVDCAAVAQLDEALELRRLSWRKPILLLGAVLGVSGAAERRERLSVILRHDFTLTLCDADLLPEADAAARAAGTALPVHIKIDTGMGRMGLTPDRAVAALRQMEEFPALRLAGVYSHFGTADLSDRTQADEQLAAFRSVLDRVAATRGRGVIRHMANTAATIERPDAHFDMVRPGIGLYGLYPAPRFAGSVELRPALRVVTHVMLTKELPAGHCVGYGCQFRTRRPTRMGLLPVGYHDGLLRALTNRMVVGTDCGDAPSIGMISMDQMAVDLTDLPGVRTGDRVVLIDERPDRPNSVASLAKLMGTIPYEVTCLLGPRVCRELTRTCDSLAVR